MKLWTGHVLDVLPTLPERSVQSCVTSPPYYGLRRYAGEQDAVWNGKDGCEHEWGEEILAVNSGGGWNDPELRHLYPPFRLKDPAKERQREVSQGSFCARCGAWKGALGLEPTPECVPTDTEMLTVNGWKSYDALLPGEQVAMYDLTDDVVRFGPLHAVAVWHYHGPMVAVKNQGLNILTTPEHRWVVKSLLDNKQKTITRFRLATDLSQNDAVIVRPGRMEPPLGRASGIGPDFAELLGWVLAEGSFKGRGGILISQSHRVNSVYVARIRTLLERLGVKHTERHRQNGMTIFTIGRLLPGTASRNRTIMAAQCNPWYDKITAVIPNRQLTISLVLSLDDAGCTGLFNGLVSGDGNRHPNGEPKTFVQRDRQTVDAFQVLALRVGYRATVASPRTSRGCYTVSLSTKHVVGLVGRSGKRSCGVATHTVSYDGIVWCPQVETGAFVARRGGRVFITGNSYVQHLVEIFRAVRRVLRDDGVLFLNLGDAYASEPCHNGVSYQRDRAQGLYPVRQLDGLKPGNLVGVPWKVAFALQADGWYLRSDVCWQKPNPQPESSNGWRWEQHRIKVRGGDRGKEPQRIGANAERPQQDHDGKNFKPSAEWEDCPGCGKCAPNGGLVLRKGSWRPTKSHEYIFMLTKNEGYYGDREAVKEPIEPYEAKRRCREAMKGLDHEFDLKVKGQPHEPSGKSTLNSIGVRASFAEGGRNLRSVWTFPTASYPESHFACVDEETECLTLGGWKRWNRLRRGDILAAYNLEDSLLRWEHLNGVAVYDYDGELFRLGGLTLGFLVTPNHRCVVRTRKARVIAIRRADTLVGGLETLCASGWEDGSFGLSDDDPGPEWAALIGWVVTEGWFNDYSVGICQSLTKNPEKVDRIRNLLTVLGVRNTVKMHTRQYNGKPSTMVSFHVPWAEAKRIRKICPDKLLTWGMIMWSKKSIRVLMETLIDGDGHRRTDDGRISFIQLNERNADIFQALAIRLGWRAIKSNRGAIGRKRVWTVYTTPRQWHGLRGTNGLKAAIEKVQYTGKVWCPSLPSGIFLARRNGRIWITGNTFPPELPRRAILASTSPKACPSCGAPWARVVGRPVLIKGRGSGNKERKIATEGERGRTNTHMSSSIPWSPNAMPTAGWKPTCSCPPEANDGSGRCIVLDPFSGSGTTVQVAEELNREGWGIDISGEYRKLQEKRTAPWRGQRRLA